MNNFEAHLIVSSRKVDSKVLRMAILVKVFLWEKGKMANVMLEILDGFLRYDFWCTGIQSPRFCKWLWIFNQSKWILVVDIPTQILLTILLSIDHSSRCKLKVYNSHQRETPYDKLKVYIIIHAPKRNHLRQIDIFRKTNKGMKDSQKSEQNLS